MVAGMPPPRCNCNDSLRAKACPVHPCPSCDLLRSRIKQLEEELLIAQFDNNVVIPELQQQVKQLEEAVDYVKEEWMMSPQQGLAALPYLFERRRSGRG